jgi:pSer/pThr/pTyr-binding forkhead associated (FHA) protein
MIRLVFKNPGAADQACELPDGAFSIGRSVNNALRILEESVSRRHCELLVFGNELIVRDCGSRHGTFVDGVRVQTQRGVLNGQVIRFGRVEAEVQLERTLEFSVDEVSTVQGLLHQQPSTRKFPREWVVTPGSVAPDSRPE